MQLKRHKLTWVLLPILCVQSFATSVVIVSTSNGIVIGADTKGVGAGGPNTIVKVTLLKKKLMVACLGNERVQRSDGLLVYDFPTWISEIDKRMSAKISVRKLADEIKKQVPIAFAAFAASIKTGNVTKEKYPSITAEGYFIEYVVVGFEKGKPTGYRIFVKINWDSKSFEAPQQVPLEMNSGPRRNLWVDAEGFKGAIDKVSSANSEQYKKLALRVPREAPAVRVGDYLSLDESSNVVRALLGMEAEGEPKTVGFPITVVSVPVDGEGETPTYKADVPRL
jgi:hypothetical protein